ncbi:MAG: glycerol kinase GlpK [Armatimonadetes bacterium]|nr:glycerol kinase GlpK [Armatimonadota bacterium]
MASYILALDQGTTSSRAILFDSAGRVCGSEQAEYPQIYPQPGWVEHNPEAIWESQLGVAQHLLQSKQVSANEIAAIGITNQRETTLLWDKRTGESVGNAIVWQDRRTSPLCEQIAMQGYADLFRNKTGLPLDPYFSGTKIRWMLDNIAGLRERAERGEIAFGTVDSFLLWRLTGGRVHATDVSNASRTLLFNIHTLDWDDELLAILQIPRSLFPEIKPNSDFFGDTNVSLFGAAIPIGGMAGDQQAATFGQACHLPGMAKNTYGTGSFLLLNTGAEARTSANGLLTTLAWRLGNTTTYALEGSVFITGAAVQWLRDELQIISSAHEIEALAASVPDNGGVYFVPAFVGLGTPYWDAHARGAILGLTRGASRAHIARATLEAVCYQSRDVLDAMQADSAQPLTELRVDGGMTRNNLLLQLQADILGIPVVRPSVTETTALGAGYLAGLAVGFWKDTDEIGGQWSAERVFEPTTTADERDSRMRGWHRAVERARNWTE